MANKKKKKLPYKKTDYTDKLGKQIADLIASGHTTRQVEAKLGVKTDTFLRWALDIEHPFSRQYVRAKQIQTESELDFMRELEYFMMHPSDPEALKRFPGLRQTRTTKYGSVIESLDTNSLRLLFDNLKWRLCKVLPKVYGDRRFIEGDITETININVSEAKDKLNDRFDRIRDKIGQDDSEESSSVH